MNGLYPKLPIVIVDDELAVLEGFEIALNSGGYNNIKTFSDSRELMPYLRDNPAELIFLDLMMPHIGGKELLKAIVASHPSVPVIIATAVSEINSVVECIRLGAQDYLLKPLDSDTLLNQVRICLEQSEMEREIVSLRESLLSGELKHPEAFSSIISQDRQMFAIFKYCEAVAPNNFPVLIMGETGTGKELIARALHELSGRKGKFVAVNVAVFDDNMFADALFGHVKGAFTGANQSRQGLIAAAVDGTLFLDEIGDLPLASQVKLLRLLQEKEYYPVGSDLPRRSNARIIASTLQDLGELKKQGKFREDLYYRFATHHVRLPPLRQRRSDVPLLLDHFLEMESIELGKNIPVYPDELLTLLESYHFPGNIREFRAMVADALARHERGVLSCESFKKFICSEIFVDAPGQSRGRARQVDGRRLPTLREAVDKVSRDLINQAMKRSGGNQSVAALYLGISQQALSQKLKKLDG